MEKSKVMSFESTNPELHTTNPSKTQLRDIIRKLSLSKLVSNEPISSTSNANQKNQDIIYAQSAKLTPINHENYNNDYRKITKIRIDMNSIKRALDIKYEQTPDLNNINKSTLNNIEKYQRDNQKLQQKKLSIGKSSAPSAKESTPVQMPKDGSKYSTFSQCITIKLSPDEKTTSHLNIKYLWNPKILNNLKRKNTVNERKDKIQENIPYNSNENSNLCINTTIPKENTIKIIKRFECLPKGMSPTANPIAHRGIINKAILGKI